MPAYTALPYQANTLPDLARAEYTTRMQLIEERWRYYDGLHRKYLKTRDGEPDYNTITNLCARVVDQSVNFLVGTLPKFDLPGEDETAQALLDAWLEINDAEDFLNDLATMASVSGHAYVKLVLEPERRNVRPVVLDSALVVAYWKPDDKTQVRAYMILWSEGEGRSMREDHVQSDSGTAWEVIRYQGDGQSWTEIGRTIWPYPFAQIVDWKNLPSPRGYYGKSDLDGVISLNDAYNFRQSNTNKILYIHAHPRTLAFGVSRDEIKASAVDGLWLIEDKESRVENLEMQTDLVSSRANAEDIKSDFFSDSQTVDLSTVKDKAGALTNFGLKLMFAEALAKNTKKRRLFGRGLSDLVYRVGAVLGFDWAGVTVNWPDPLPENTVEQVGNAKEVISMGVSSRQTQAERLGYDWEKESQRIADERKAGAMQLGQVLADQFREEDDGEEDEEA